MKKPVEHSAETLSGILACLDIVLPQGFSEDAVLDCAPTQRLGCSGCPFPQHKKADSFEIQNNQGAEQ